MEYIIYLERELSKCPIYWQNFEKDQEKSINDIDSSKEYFLAITTRLKIEFNAFVKLSDINSDAPHQVIFDNHADYTHFILKWS